MPKNKLKKRLCDAIDAARDRIVEVGEAVRRTPELAFHEHRTAARLAAEFRRLSLPRRENLAVTGMRADVAGDRPGPTVAIFGEMDAIRLPEHPDADPESGAAHACGHHAQCAALIGAAIGLALPEVRQNLAGRVALFAVPAEEHHEETHYEALLQSGRLRHTSGKRQLIHEGALDDVGVAMMIHSGHTAFTPASFNGFVLKNAVFEGTAAHAGLMPSAGVNALAMARLALAAVDAQRDTFKDEDAVRIHGIITHGGDAINVVPSRVELTLQIRARTPAAVAAAAARVDRSLRSGALALGGAVRIATELGYLPFKSCPELEALHRDNLERLVPGSGFHNTGHRPSSTDMGDVSMIIPSLHAYTGGTAGTPHQTDFRVVDPEQAYVLPAKLLAMNAVELLYGDGETGRAVAALPTELTRAEYLTAIRDRVAVTDWNYREPDLPPSS